MKGGTHSELGGSYVCTQCEAPVKRVHQLEKTGLMSLCSCGSCGKIADPYCEFSYVPVVIDIILMRNGAVTHLVYNRGNGVRWAYLLTAYIAGCFADSQISGSFSKSFIDITAIVFILTTILSMIYRMNPLTILPRVLCGTWYLLPLFLCAVWDYSQPCIPIPFFDFQIRGIYLPRFGVLVSWGRQLPLVKPGSQLAVISVITIIVAVYVFRELPTSYQLPVTIPFQLSF
eukprot:TRINITY_DN24497_c0_g1_i1.p1 TRINITY_DN24497_c0_g1~~TRINITY_DN24497_c0_g1_i1.p1  ORF type:complete len:230 (+),score=20.60 TRINITY_DN24497_c0_g1_i1:110-799(+)